jgi:hypothetical protein
MRGAGSRSPTRAAHGVPCLACTGESNCPQLSKNNLILRQCKWSRREDTPPTASEVANMDMVEVIVGVLLLLLGVVIIFCSSRKVIILDLTEADASHILAFAAAVLALGVVYWLIRDSDQRLGEAA